MGASNFVAGSKFTSLFTRRIGSEKLIARTCISACMNGRLDAITVNTSRVRLRNCAAIGDNFDVSKSKGVATGGKAFDKAVATGNNRVNLFGVVGGHLM